MILGGKKIKISTGDSPSEGAQSSPQEPPMGDGDRDADFSKLDGGNPSAEEGQPTPAVEGTEGDGQLDALRAEVAEHKDRYIRTLADFENYKKRALKERSELIKYQGERIIGDFLEVLDTLELALTHSESDPKKLSEGIKLIHKMFVDTLGRWEVRADPAMGSDFDPVKHKAISRLVVPNTKSGTVVGELKKPYFYKDKLLRPGEVVVAAEPETEAPAGEPSAES
jgi:molecular chaperone GrpE